MSPALLKNIDEITSDRNVLQIITDLPLELNEWPYQEKFPHEMKISKAETQAARVQIKTLIAKELSKKCRSLHMMVSLAMYSWDLNQMRVTEWPGFKTIQYLHWICTFQNGIIIHYFGYGQERLFCGNVGPQGCIPFGSHTLQTYKIPHFWFQINSTCTW